MWGVYKKISNIMEKLTRKHNTILNYIRAFEIDLVDHKTVKEINRKLWIPKKSIIKSLFILFRLGYLTWECDDKCSFVFKLVDNDFDKEEVMKIIKDNLGKNINKKI